MNRIKFITNLIGIFLCLVSNVQLKGFDSSENNRSIVSDEVIEKRIRNLKSNVDLQYTGEVRRSIRMYTYNYRRGSEHLLGKVAIYFPLFEEEIRKKQLPEELKYLAIIESNLKPDAISHVGATGLWQFMKGTARMYDLEMTGTVDERRDPRKSTEAALNYLADLFNQFGDWTLAIAAYNCGPGNVRKAIRLSNSKDYWKLRHYLPKETQEYVPRFVAASYLLNYYHAHDLNPKQADNELVYTSSTKIYQKLKFSEISDKTGLELRLIKELNPAYLRNYIPEGEGRYTLTLPEKNMKEFVAKLFKDENLEDLDQMGPEAREQLLRILKFQIPGFIQEAPIMPDATPYQESENDHLDNLDNSRQMPLDLTQSEGEALIEQKKYSKIRYEYYKLADKETIYDVAKKRDDVSLYNLLELNHYSLNNLPKSGTIIKLKQL